LRKVTNGNVTEKWLTLIINIFFQDCQFYASIFTLKRNILTLNEKLEVRFYPEGCVELAFCGLHAVHAHGVEAEHGVKLGTMTN
jgi:hypothetical protein